MLTYFLVSVANIQMFSNWYGEKYHRTLLVTYIFYFLEMLDDFSLHHFNGVKILISNNEGIMKKNEAYRNCVHRDIFSLND